MSYTNIDQSKRLLELGLSPESADMAYFYWINHKNKTSGIDDVPTILAGLTIEKCDIPCWSVGALLKVMPKWNDYSPYIGKNECYYSNDDNEIYHREVGTSVEAAYNMVVWLLKNEFIKK